MAGTIRLAVEPGSFILCKHDTLINTPSSEGVNIRKPMSGVIFDGGHDVEGHRSPKAHLDAVLRNLSHHLGHPCTSYGFIHNYLAPHKRLCKVGAFVGGEEVKAGAPSCRPVAEGLQVVAPRGRAEQLLLSGNDRSPLARQPGRAPQRLLPV